LKEIIQEHCILSMSNTIPLKSKVETDVAAMQTPRGAGHQVRLAADLAVTARKVHQRTQLCSLDSSSHIFEDVALITSKRDHPHDRVFP
jgi:hypothetical protein